MANRRNPLKMTTASGWTRYSWRRKVSMKNLILCVLAPAALLASMAVTASTAEQELNACHPQETQQPSSQKQAGSTANPLQIPVPVQGNDQGCCVLKQGEQADWRYVYTSRDNCATTAESLGVPYAFHKDRRCEDVPKPASVTRSPPAA